MLRKYGFWLLLIVSILLPVIIVFLIYAIDFLIFKFDFRWMPLPGLDTLKDENKINVVDTVTAIATVFSAVATAVSAAGLIFFGYLTYGNQKKIEDFQELTYRGQQNNEFYSLFNTLLNEHNRLLKDLIESEDKKAKVDKINQSVLLKIIFNFNDGRCKKLIESCKINNGLTEEDKKRLKEAKYRPLEDLREHLQSEESEIKYVVEIKPYLIILFRLLKCIYTTKKISDGDKSDYYALVRGLIPMEILLLILFNSQVWPEEEKLGQVGEVLNYKKLLKKAKLFEHLPIENKILKEILCKNPLGVILREHEDWLEKVDMGRNFYLAIQDMEKAFGDSVYVKKYKEKASKA